MKLQAAVIFTSLQNAKFTSTAGYTSYRPTYIESFMTIFGQGINVLNYKRVSMGLSVWRETSKKLTVCREKGKKLTVCRELFLFR